VTVDPRLAAIAAAQPYPLVFATVSGAHLYGFPSADSDFDLRGVHVLPVREVIGLATGPDTLQTAEVRDGLDLDLVTHDLTKFCGLLLRRNGYVLEQLYSPLIVTGGPAHDELKAIGTGCITSNHAHHYLGFAGTQWSLYEKQHRLKPLLYVFRVLKTGIRLMRTGSIEANLTLLFDDEPRVPYLADLIAAKQAEGEQAVARADQEGLYLEDIRKLQNALESARDDSWLPALPAATAAAGLNEFAIRTRLGSDPQIG
jgi:predicted nucleotidyltransferase